MAGTSYLLDSNVLLRWVQPRSASYAEVHRAIDTLLDSKDQVTLCYTSQNVSEFWNVCTRPPAANGFGLSPFETDSRARSFESRFRLLPDSFEVHQKWRRLLVDHEISGVQVHDARLVASMMVHRVRNILTLNARDFLRYPEIRAIHPRDTSL